MRRDEKHVIRLRLATVLVAAVAVIGAGCSGGEETASGVASVADVEVAATPEAEESTEPQDTPVPEATADDAGAAEDLGAEESTDTPVPEATADDAGAAEDLGDEEETTDEEKALAFVACVREAGIDEMPDPTVSADGTVQLLPVGPQRQLLNDPDFQEAAEECIFLIEDATFFSAAPDISAIEDSLLQFAQCLRENGVDVDDPDLSKFVPGEGARMFGDNFDPQDPANADAIAACQSLLPNAAGN